jgi:hypothetical protein
LLFNDVNSSYYIALNGMIAEEWRTGKNMEGSARGQI